MIDMSQHLTGKSDHLTADMLLAGPRELTVAAVVASPQGEDRPVEIRWREDALPWRPCLSMRRVLAAIWGGRTEPYVGRRLRLWRDPDVRFGSDLVGGIRIQAASHIETSQTVMVQVKRGRKAPIQIAPLRGDARPTPTPTPTQQQQQPAQPASSEPPTIEELIERHEIQPEQLDGWLHSLGRPAIADLRPEQAVKLRAWLASPPGAASLRAWLAGA